MDSVTKLCRHYEQHPAGPLGPNTARQTDGPHAHTVSFPPTPNAIANTTTAANVTVLACDLGLDQLIQSKFDTATGKLVAEQYIPATEPGAGLVIVLCRCQQRASGMFARDVTLSGKH
jgi:hypothetical protein